jgi:hypothetical protein
MAREKVVVLTLDRDVSKLAPQHVKPLRKPELVGDRTVGNYLQQGPLNAGGSAFAHPGTWHTDVTTKEALTRRRLLRLTSTVIGSLPLRRVEGRAGRTI